MKKSYLILLIGFLLVIIYNEVNNKVLDNTNIVVNYNKYLEDELNTLRNFKVNDNLDLVLTKVKYRNMYGSDLVIYRGFNDLIKKGDAILTNDGLVGIVKKTYSDSSIVDLITSRDSAISVSIGDYFGILKCINNELVITDINNYSNPSDELKKHLEEFHKLILVCKNLGMKVEGVSIDKTLLDAIPSVYVCISCAEATSNMSNLTGLIFGPRGNGVNVVDMMKDYRTKGFSPLIKRRFVIGSYVLQKENQERYYLNACRVRRLIVDKFKSLFKEYDGCIMPVGSGVAPLISEANNTITDNDVNVLENHLQIANFGGFPSITIPSGFINNLPVGLNITGNCYKDQEVLNIAYAIEEKLDYKNVIARDYNE